MSGRELADQRMRNHRISGEPLADADEVVRWLGAIQAQEYAVAKWSIGQRTTGSSEAALDEAMAAGTLLRTHVLRPTWHFVLPADIRWMIELTGPRVHGQNAYWYRRFELDEALLARTNDLLAAALTGGAQLTRTEIEALLAGHGIAAKGLRMGYLLMRAELDLVTCSGGLRGKQQTYALLDERAPEARSLDREEALAELTRRYFTSRGPATVKDYAWWSSLTVADAKRGLEMVRSQLERREVGDRTYWFSDSPGRSPASPRADLLQGYDEYAIAYGESRDVLDVAGIGGIVPGGEAMFTHAILLDGQVVGHWRRALKARSMTIDVQLGRRLDAAQRDALDDAVERYAAFVGVPATWTEPP